MNHLTSAHRTLSARVFKAIGIFGSAEGLAMVCSVVRTKLVALWIGAAGVGLFGLFNSVVEMLGALTQSGVRNSAVREIAAANDYDKKVNAAVSGRRLGIRLGILIGTACALLSPLFSLISFGGYGYWWAFAWLGIALLINSITAIESGILQGFNRLQGIAKASVSGSLLALTVSVPILYIWRMDGIVPVILAYSVCIGGAYWWQRVRGIKAKKELSSHNKPMMGIMLRFGIYLTVSGFVLWIVNYILLSVVNNMGGEADMGYYQCGYTLIIRYMGVVFSAIGMEFFPRLSSAVGKGMSRGFPYVNHEIFVVLNIVVPMGAVLAALAPFVIRLLYSASFLAAVPFVVFALVSCGFRCASWCIGFMIVAKGDGKLYMWVEAISGLCCLIFSLSGYMLFGIAGLGYAYILWYAVYLMMVYAVCYRKYGYRIGIKTGMAIVSYTFALLAVVLLSMYVSWWVALCAAAILSVLCLRFLLRR